jgi:hypothetical protein
MIAEMDFDLGLACFAACSPTLTMKIMNRVRSANVFAFCVSTKRRVYNNCP